LLFAGTGETPAPPLAAGAAGAPTSIRHAQASEARNAVAREPHEYLAASLLDSIPRRAGFGDGDGKQASLSTAYGVS
jgi:hypothetical protein